MINLKKINILLSTIVVVLTASLLYFKVFLNSDTLFLDSLSTDLFVHGGHWGDWRFPPAPAYLPDMLLYFLSYPLFPDAPWRIFFVSAMQVFMLAATVVWLAKKINPKLSDYAISTLLLMVAFVTLVAAKSGMWLYFYSANNHFASLLFSLLSVGLFIRFFEKPTWLLATLLVFIGGAAKASSAIYLICFIAPALILILTLLMILNRSITHYQLYRKRLIGVFAILMASLLFSVLCDELLTYNNPLDGRTPGSIVTIGSSFVLFLQATKNVFAFDNKLTLTFSLLVVSAFLFLLYRLLSRFNLDSKSLTVTLHSGSTSNVHWHVVFCAMFLAIVIPINVVCAIFSGGFIDLAGYRYFMFPIAFTLILTIVLFDQHLKKTSNLWTIFNFIFICFITGISIERIHDSIRRPPSVNLQAQQNQHIAHCLSDIEFKGFTLQAGVANYWNATAVTYYLTKKHPILATKNDLMPFFWMSTIGPITHPLEYTKYLYNFVIVQNIGEAPFWYTPDILEKILPPPSSIHECPDSNAQIWLYNSRSLDVIIQRNFDSFKHQLTEHFVALGATLPGLIGQSERSTRVADELHDKPGLLSYGPYINLKHGKYNVVLKYSAKNASKPIVGYIDMGGFSEKTTILHQENLLNTPSGQVSFILEVPFFGFKHFEARTWFAGEGKLIIKSLEIIKR